jgi:hypothetical protein
MKKVYELGPGVQITIHDDCMRTVRKGQEVFIPEGYEVVYEGFMDEGYIVWTREGFWDLYPGTADSCDAVDEYTLVARKMEVDCES